EQLEARRSGIEANQPERCGAFFSRRYVDGEATHSDAAFALAQIRQPDQAEGKRSPFVSFGRASDSRPAMLSMAQITPRKCGRKAEFQVRFGAEFHELPLWKLPPQKQPEAFPEYQPCTAPARLHTHRPCQIKQKQLPLAAAEPLHHEFQTRRRFALDRDD